MHYLGVFDMIDTANNNMNEKIWSNTLSLLESSVSRPIFETWIKNTTLTLYSGEHVIIKVRNDFEKGMLENQLFNVIKNCLESVLNHSVKIKFVTPQEQDKAIEQLFQQQGYTKEDFQKEETTYSNTAGTTQFQSNATTAEQDFATSFTKPNGKYEYTGNLINLNLNAKYTFDSFVVGSSNMLTHAACIAVADNIANEMETRLYNPLFIYGDAGLGKTHLMHAIGNHILSRKPDTKIAYISSEKFTNELIDSIKDGSTKNFREKYRNVDVLLIDDIQFLSNKESTQEEFFHTFNTLYDANKQIIISSDRLPNEIPKLEERLRTRFSMGLTTDIQPPDYETRIAILRKKAQADNLQIPDDVFDYIAEHIHSNIRELEGVLVRLSAFSNLSHRNIDMNLTKECLQGLITPNEPIIITGDLILKKVAEYYRIRPEDFTSKKRTKQIAYPRQIAMYLCREMTNLSLPKIGELFGGRDHSTVIHACDKIAEELRTDQTLQVTVNKIKNSLTSNN